MLTSKLIRTSRILVLLVLLALADLSLADFAEFSYNEYLYCIQTSRTDLTLHDNLNEFFILSQQVKIENFEEFNSNQITVFISDDQRLCDQYESAHQVGKGAPDYYDTKIKHEIDFSKLYPRSSESSICVIYHDPLIWRNLSNKVGPLS